MITGLIADVVGLNLHQEITNSLDAKLEAAVKALDDLKENNDVAAINKLHAFVSAVVAQSGDKIPVEDSNKLLATAQAIIDVLST